jgi:hypothetical protein
MTVSNASSGLDPGSDPDAAAEPGRTASAVAQLLGRSLDPPGCGRKLMLY